MPKAYTKSIMTDGINDSRGADTMSKIVTMRMKNSNIVTIKMMAHFFNIINLEKISNPFPAELNAFSNDTVYKLAKMVYRIYCHYKHFFTK